ncbi:MAG: transcriptional regulator, GntR family [Firmicutes bacterium]|nr:transcriptional regulator, GntR family [Bacillota bacterium]
MTKLVKQVFTEQIYHLLRNDILSQSIACSQKLNIRELQAKYGVSGSPVREAISRLHQEGLVEYLPNIGTKVIDFKVTDIVELQELHSSLDCSALKLAMKKNSYQDIAAELLVFLEAQKQNDPSAAHQFHNTFYRFANNNRLQKSWEHLTGQLEIIHTLYANQLKALAWNDIELHDHTKIYESVSTNDLETALARIEEHHDKSLTLLLDCIK